MVDEISKTEVALVICQAATPDDIEVARALFKEYEQSLGISLCFQNFDQEVANLPGDYSPPSGRLLLARVEDQVVGCIALRKLNDNVCEMKRLYLRPVARGKGSGAKMIDAVLTEAKQIGYSKMRLDTMPGRMDQAIKLYRTVGFHEIPPYYDNPTGRTLYMELDLSSR
jgi:GNAT superfamily N-acetyltransferase